MKISDEELQFYSQLTSDFAISDEELWNAIQTQIKVGSNAVLETPSKKRIFKLDLKYFMSAAAVIVLLFSVGFMKFYKVTIHTEKENQTSHFLPDGSQVFLNQDSKISYHPLWWSFDRSTTFSGEAFFEVKKGSKFSVISKNAITKVLGTSFNVYARNRSYKVFCKTGKVSVQSSIQAVNYVLRPNEIAIIDYVNKKANKSNASFKDAVLWKHNNKVSYFQTPLQEVLEMIEREYQISIVTKGLLLDTYKYTASFKKPEKVETLLDLICQNFNFIFKRENRNTYVITEK